MVQLDRQSSSKQHLIHFYQFTFQCYCPQNSVVYSICNYRMGRPKIKGVNQPRKAVEINGTKFHPVNSVEKKVIDKSRKQYQSTEEWAIDYGKYDKFCWKENFTYIESAPIKKLWLNDNQSNCILKSIPPVKLPNLQILHLENNYIGSLTPLAEMKTPQLYRLQLSDNQITDLRGLRRAHFPILAWLNLANNPISDYSPLAELHTKKLEKLVIKRAPFPMLDENVSWLMQMETGELKVIDLTTFRRVPQEEALNQISLRFDGSKIEWSTGEQ